MWRTDVIQVSPLPYKGGRENFDTVCETARVIRQGLTLVLAFAYLVTPFPQVRRTGLETWSRSSSLLTKRRRRLIRILLYSPSWNLVEMILAWFKLLAEDLLRNKLICSIQQFFRWERNCDLPRYIPPLHDGRITYQYFRKRARLAAPHLTTSLGKS